MQKDHMEIILEDIRTKFGRVLEGHDVSPVTLHD